MLNSQTLKKFRGKRGQTAKQYVQEMSNAWLLSTTKPHGKDLTFYGNNKAIQFMTDQEIMLSGPADTGKTLACLYHLNKLAWKYPGSQMAIIRKTAASMPGSVLQTYQDKVIEKEIDNIEFYGGEHRANRYIYPNGSTIWIGGLDKASKVLSSERDVIYVNQAEELNNTDWEYLLTRANGRAGHMPYGMVFGDCNPAHPSHWIQSRRKKGLLKFLEVSHKDNPSIYDPITGEITENGKLRIASLERLTGNTRMRLLHGLWAAPEGAIYSMFDETVHKISAFPIPKHWMRVVGVDPLGAYTAAVWLAYDPQNAKLIVYREYYEPFGVSTPEHVRNALKLSGYTEYGTATPESEPIMAWVGGGPSENQSRLDWENAGIPLLENEIVDVWSQIDRVMQLLNENSLLIMDNCINLLSEIGSYKRKLVNGEVVQEIDNKEAFHLLDALRYIIAWLMTPVEVQRVGRINIDIGNY